MTVGSDCSSTISSEDEASNNTSSSSHVQDGSSSQTVISASPVKRWVQRSSLINVSHVCDVVRSVSSLEPRLGEDMMDGVDDDKKRQDLSPSTKTRLANLFNRIPKLGNNSPRKDDSVQVSENKVNSSAKQNTSVNSSIK